MDICRNIAVIGSTGQLGKSILATFGDRAISLPHEKIEVKDIHSCENALKDVDIIINCAAYTNVDRCEIEPAEAFMVNAIGARNLALLCKKKEIINVYISTDFVFDGEKGEPYHEDDIPNPINTYGITKYAGEIFTKNCCDRFYIIRTSSLYGKTGARGKGGNFVEWMIEKAGGDEAITVVDDIVMSPTSTKDVAEMIKNIVDKRLPFGIYHVANQGHCSWFEFAKKIFQFLKIDANLSPIKTHELKRKAKRPRFSAIESKNLSRFGLNMRGWDDALKLYLKDMGYI